MLKDDIVNMLNLDYTQCVEFLKQKYGRCLYDYFCAESCKTQNNKADRSSEGLFIHHIDSNIYNGLSSKHTALNHPFSAQKADRLVYCNYLELLLLHIKVFEDWLAEKCTQIGLGAVLIILPELDRFYRTGHFAKAKQQIYSDAIKDGIEEYKLILQHLSNIASNGKVDESILQEIHKYTITVMKTKYSPGALASNASASDPELINKIKNHKLGNKEEAFDLYNSLCDFLKEKYGLVDNDYDNNPTKRGKEWIDIHHIREYELDDIAKRTDQAKGKLLFPIFSTMCTIEELKPYNVKEQLVYANKIEHFLLHYLIDSIRGREIFSGGPNYLWDSCVALEWYGFDRGYMQKLQVQKDDFYKLITSEEITFLYKKLIDWKKWNLQKCRVHWTTYNHMTFLLDTERVSYITDKEKFFKLFNIIQYQFNEKTLQKINEFPFKVRTVDYHGTTVKLIKDNYYSSDEKTILRFSYSLLQKTSFTIPSNIEKIGEDAFHYGARLQTITVPTTVKGIADKTFVHRFSARDYRSTPNLTTVIYKGTQQEWNEKFSNVDLDGITLVCKK